MAARRLGAQLGLHTQLRQLQGVAVTQSMWQPGLRLFRRDLSDRSPPPPTLTSSPTTWPERVPGVLLTAAVAKLGFIGADTLGTLIPISGIPMALLTVRKCVSQALLFLRVSHSSPLLFPLIFLSFRLFFFFFLKSIYIFSLFVLFETFVVRFSMLFLLLPSSSPRQGFALSNVRPTLLPAAVRPGVDFASTQLLRLGIVCVGFKLSLPDVLQSGLHGLPVVAATVGTGLLVIPRLSRLCSLPPRLGALLAAGTSICGVTAIVTLAPLIKATQREVAVATANVVAFGLGGMLLYPYVAQAICHSPEQVGVFLGTAVHDTSQVRILPAQKEQKDLLKEGEREE